MVRITLSNLDEVFSYHAPSSDQIARMNAVRECGKELARAVLQNCPEVPDRTRVLNEISDLCMLANKAIILEKVGG
jgi:hypothetical protein